MREREMGAVEGGKAITAILFKHSLPTSDYVRKQLCEKKSEHFATLALQFANHVYV
jgi:hypothetical protein